VSRVIALTGNVASGKSTVARLFVEWGATLIDADAIVRELQRPGQEVFARLLRRFGTGILDSDGTLDRSALRRLMLRDAAAKADLEAIVHPAVRARQVELITQARRRSDPIIVVDIPLLFEVGDPAAYDAVVVVDAPTTLRRDRLMEHRGLTADEADDLIASQMPAAQKRERADIVIDNDGSLAALERGARAAWTRLES
jgi:dephospho-CoA kinase